LAPGARRDAQPREPCLDLRAALAGIERRLDQRRVAAGAHHLAARAVSGGDRQRALQQALAGAGLAGDDVEPWTEAQLEVLDQREVLDAQEPQHVVVSAPSRAWCARDRRS